MKFLTFGELMLRLSPGAERSLSQEIPGKLEACFGGAEANTAVALCALGATATFVSALPTGPVADAGIRALAARGVDTNGIARTENGRLGLYYLTRGAALRPSTVIYDREYSAFAEAGKDTYQWEQLLKGCNWFHTSGINPALNENAAERTREAMAAAAAAGLSISVDLNYRGRLWRWGGGKPDALARKVMSPLLAEATLVVGNEEDAWRVLGLEVPGLDLINGQLDPTAYADLTRQAAAMLPKARYIAFSLRISENASRNLWGGVLFDVEADQVFFHPAGADGNCQPLLIDPVIDRVGGGDAFAAGLLCGLAHRRNLPAQALALAVSAGALAQTFQGDWLEASLDEVEALARGEGSGRIRR